MFKTKFLVLAAAFVLLLSGAAHLKAQTKDAVRILTIRAQLSYEDKGIFSKDTLSDENFDL